MARNDLPQPERLMRRNPEVEVILKDGYRVGQRMEPMMMVLSSFLGETSKDAGGGGDDGEVLPRGGSRDLEEGVEEVDFG